MFFTSTTPEKKLSPLIEAILNKKKKATFFLGAGISTSCGIPDFRSPKTGLYSNLEKLDLPYPEAVFDIDYFKDSPKAFYTLCDELYPGKFVPSKFHYLIKLFQEKGHLKRVYTQNIDTLERIAGIDDEYMVEAHGSFAKNHCIDCHEEISSEHLKKCMDDKTTNDGIPVCTKCLGYVKPDIVFFGEGLPERFFKLWEEDADDVDVAIVAGTSLTVMPFASLPAECGKKTLRALLNKEVVGDFKYGRRRSDIILELDCDEAAETLAELLGWRQELDELFELAKAKFAGETTTAEEEAQIVAEAIAKEEAAEEEYKKDFDEKVDEKEEPESKKEDDTGDVEKKLGKLSL